MIGRFYAWLLPIKPIKIDMMGTLGWKWYGDTGQVKIENAEIREAVERARRGR